MNANQKAKKIVTDLSEECEYWIESFRQSTKHRCDSMTEEQVETFRGIVSISQAESELDHIKKSIMISVIDDKMRGVCGALVESSEFVQGDL